MKCVIVEDELPAIEILKNHISHYEELHLVKVCHTAMEAFEYLHKNPADLIFVDIQMPGISGIQLIESLRVRPDIILTTAFREYALQGYELEVADYLLKPISLERFSKSIGKIFRNRSMDMNKVIGINQPLLDEPFIYVKIDREFQKIELADLLYIESLRNNLKFVTEKGIYIAVMPISQIEAKLPNYFLRVHRSFIISTRHIDKFSSTYVIIKNTQIPVGNFYKMNFQQWLSGNM